MLDGFDLLGGAFIGPRGPGKDASPGEQVAAAITQLLFPALIFSLVLFAGLWKHMTVMVVATLVLSLAGYAIARFLSERLSFALLTALAGFLWNFMALGAAGLLGGLVGFYQMF